jgi:hypothetical protein
MQMGTERDTCGSYSQRKKPRYPLNKRLRGPTIGLEAVANRNILPPSKFNPESSVIQTEEQSFYLGNYLSNSNFEKPDTKLKNLWA